jgi:hypothetical protein
LQLCELLTNTTDKFGLSTLTTTRALADLWILVISQSDIDVLRVTVYNNGISTSCPQEQGFA